MTLVQQFQARLQSYGLYLGPIDDDPGPSTALAYARALQSGPVTPGEEAVAAVRETVRRRTPKQSSLRMVYGPGDSIIADDPARPGACVFTDGGAWRTRNIRSFEVPLVGQLALHRRAAGAFISALADVRALTTYRPGRASSYCLRHMNWNPAQPLTTHATGFAVDFDLDQDGRWERVEQDRATWWRESPAAAQVIDLMEAWGLVWGGTWGGKSRDDMHFQYARVG